MSIAEQINRISEKKNIIRDKMRDMKLIAVDASPSIDTLASTLRDDVRIDSGDTARNCLEGSSITLSKGYYPADVTVYGITNEAADKQKIKGIADPITPTKSEQVFNVPDGYYGYGSFTVKKIPDVYKDTSDATVYSGSDVLSGKIFYNSEGRQVGTMPNNGTLGLTLKFEDAFMPVPIGTGYYEGGEVGVAVRETIDEVTPTTTDRLIQPSEDGKFLLGVKVKGDENLTEANIASGKTIFGVKGTYTNDADAIAANILKNKTAYVGGQKVTGAMENRGNVGSVEINALSASPIYTILSGYYDGGEVSIAGNLETELSKI